MFLVLNGVVLQMFKINVYHQTDLMVETIPDVRHIISYKTLLLVNNFTTLYFIIYYFKNLQ